MSVSVFQGVPQFAHTSRERIITDDHVRPNGIDQFVFGNQASGVLDQIPEKLEAFGSKLDFATRIPETTTDQVEGVFIKGVQLSLEAPHLFVPCYASVFRGNLSRISALFEPAFKTSRTPPLIFPSPSHWAMAVGRIANDSDFYRSRSLAVKRINVSEKTNGGQDG